MKAVIWTDVLQAIIMFVGMLAGIIQGKSIFRQLAAYLLRIIRFLNVSSYFLTEAKVIDNFMQ